MIKETIIYTIICDRCGKDSNRNYEYSGWGDSEYAWGCALEDNWVEYENNHYCPNCYKYNDDGNLVIIE